MKKYYEIHGHDVSSFDVSTTHRLPTVSAADALADLENGDSAGFVSSGLPSLDRILANADPDDSETFLSGGLLKGELTEIWGPPGSGKTAIGIQVAANALKDGGRVTWVDAFHPVCRSRLEAVLECVSRFEQLGLGPETSGKVATQNKLQHLDHFTCPSLAHFVALVCRSTSGLLSADTSVLIIDCLSALINRTYPRAPEARRTASSATGKANPGSSMRRIQVLQNISEALQKLAATNNLTVLILSQCATKMHFELGASIIPSLASTVWEQGTSTRLVLFKDWIWRGNQPSTVHFIGVQRLNGKPGDTNAIVAFTVSSDGICEVPHDAGENSAKVPSPTRKRKFDETSFEIPDSDEEYGWDEDEENVMPRTLGLGWQGSEDILIRPDEAHEPPGPFQGDEGIQDGSKGERDAEEPSPCSPGKV